MTDEYDQRTPQTHLHPALIRDSSGHLGTFGMPCREWSSPHVAADSSVAPDVSERARAAAAGRQRAFAGELPLSGGEW